ncbi:MAG: hypothetical protein H7315_19555 [Herminiimonas sp.]|nr:hypothetical protein [Herminiimonas sp.]
MKRLPCRLRTPQRLQLTDFVLLHATRIKCTVIKIVKVKAVPQAALVGISLAWSCRDDKAAFGTRLVSSENICAALEVGHAEHVGN